MIRNQYLLVKKILAASGLLTTVFYCGVLYAQPESHSGERKARPERPQFSEIDADGDGSVLLSEFQQLELPRGDHSSVFDHIDTNTDGVITEQEWQDHKPPRKGR